MDITKIDKAVLKSIVREIIKEDRTLVKEIIEEILIENQVIVTKEQRNRRKKVDQLIAMNFDKYEEVFKALA